jgi:hypothetical protein
MNDEQKTTRYHIYGRKSYAQPLAYVQTRSAPAIRSLPAPEGDDWVEVVAFPVSAAIQVIPREKERERSR